MSLARSLARSLALARVMKKHHIAFATAATAELVVMHVELARNTRSSSFPILIIAQSTNKNNIILIYRLNFSASKSCSPGPGICRVPHYIERSCPGFSSQIDNQRWRCWLLQVQLCTAATATAGSPSDDEQHKSGPSSLRLNTLSAKFPVHSSNRQAVAMAWFFSGRSYFRSPLKGEMLRCTEELQRRFCCQYCVSVKFCPYVIHQVLSQNLCRIWLLMTSTMEFKEIKNRIRLSEDEHFPRSNGSDPLPSSLVFTEHSFHMILE